MAKPTVLPRWANVGGSVATPAAGKLDIGWLPGEKPPAQYENWKGLHTYNWIAWLDALFPSDNLTLDLNKSVIISGTGLYKHPDKPRKFSACGVTGSNFTQAAGYVQLNTGAIVYMPIVVNSGERITRFVAYVRDSGAATINAKLWRYTASGAGTLTQIGSTISSVGSGGSSQSLDTGVAALAENVGGVDANLYFFEITLTGTAVDERFYGVELVVSTP